jgi:NADH:ubiquinone oxidoreductase subunit 6 (subunit J)
VAGAFGVALLVFGVLITIIFRTPWQPAAVRSTDWSVNTLGAYLLTRYDLAFEVISIVLLVAILGAILISSTSGRRSS